ncbi:MAG: RnfABCDGE type electron transport complex subunit D [Candidatus Woesearchaeota archaeon]
MLKKSSSPHIHKKTSKQKIMYLVVLALLPATFTGIYYFGVQAAWIIATAIIAALATDILMQRLTSPAINWLNGSAVITGLLLALVLPPTVPLWIPAIGSIFAVSLGKYTFGVGNNIFNPALIGRAFLVISWPQLMSGWIAPDGITAATPLAETAQLSSLIIGEVAGCIGETSAIAILLGGLFLISLRLIDWKIPVFYIGTVAALMFFAGNDPLYHIMAGGLMLGAFFMATDYVTSPLTTKGRIIFAVGLGILTFIFRFYSSMPEGVMYSVLLMNATVPLIERYTKPKPFGK